MPFCDLHIHSIRSSCGFHTLLEIVDIMRKKNNRAFALTDHDPSLKTPPSHFSVLLKRMPSFIEGIRVFKGIEASIEDCDGNICIPEFEGVSYEVILAGLHPNVSCKENMNIERNTQAVVNTMKKHPEVNIITHPFYESFPLDIDIITSVALETQTALEINNSYLLNNKADKKQLTYMLDLAKEKGTMLAVSSDGHVFSEMAEFDLAIEFMKPYGIDNLNIVNRTLESTLDFLGLEE